MTRMKMKRKDLELDEFSEDFSDFSLSSPARKIRRLDAGLPPIMEEEEAEILPEVGGGVMEHLALPSNDERAIVLFKPMNTSFMQSAPSNLSVSVDSDIISGFKSQLLGSNQSDRVKLSEEEAMEDRKDDRLAVIPWVPSQLPPAPATGVAEADALDMMEEAEEMEAATMDVEEDNNSNASIEQVQPNIHIYGGIAGSDGLHQWQQQHHCMVPQLPQNTSTPITWFR